MKLTESETVRRLEEIGDKLLLPPDRKEELINLLEEAESVLKNVGQCPSQALRDAVILETKALIADSLFKNPDSDVRVVLAVCFNEITRITAPDPPYDDDRMKEVFELIVEAFDSLSALCGRSYDKAVSIIVSVANVRSCVLMLDLDCEDLIIKMFEQFQKNIRPDHPKAVFSAMKTIMTLIIEESEPISLELLKVLLNSVHKENEKISSMSWKLFTEVIELTAKMLEPHLRKAISSGLINEVDYASIVKSIYQGGSDGLEHNDAGQSAEQAAGANKSVTSSSLLNFVQSGDHAAKSGLSAKMLEPHLREVISSGLINEADYAPIVKSIYQGGSDGLEDKDARQSAEQAVGANKPVTSSSQFNLVQSEEHAAESGFSAKMFEPHLREAISSGLINEVDFAEILKSICQGGSDGLEHKDAGHSAEQAVGAEKPLTSSSLFNPVQSGDNAAKSGLDPQSQKRKRDSLETEKSSKELKRSKPITPPRSPHSEVEPEPENVSKGIPSKTGRSLNDHNVGNGAASKKSWSTSRGRSKTKFSTTSSNYLHIKSCARRGGNVRKESDVLGDSERKNHQVASVQKKKVGRPKKNFIAESEDKSAKNKKEVDKMDEPSKKVTQRESIQEDGEIFETPYGRKKYEDVVGYKVKVYWQMDKKYYGGRIVSYDPTKMLHKVEYDDGEVECLDLQREKFEFTAAACEVDLGAKTPLTSPSMIHPVQSGSGLGSQSQKRKFDNVGTEKSSKGLKHSKSIMSPRSSHTQDEPVQENGTKGVPRKTGRRPNSQDRDLGNGAASKKSLPSPRVPPETNVAAVSSKSLKIKFPASKSGNVRKEFEVLFDSEGKNHQVASVQHKDVSSPERDFITESVDDYAKNKKEADRMNEPSRMVTQRKGNQEDEELIAHEGSLPYVERLQNELNSMRRLKEKAVREKEAVVAAKLDVESQLTSTLVQHTLAQLALESERDEHARTQRKLDEARAEIRQIKDASQPLSALGSGSDSVDAQRLEEALAEVARLKLKNKEAGMDVVLNAQKLTKQLEENKKLRNELEQLKAGSPAGVAASAGRAAQLRDKLLAANKAKEEANRKLGEIRGAHSQLAVDNAANRSRVVVLEEEVKSLRVQSGELHRLIESLIADMAIECRKRILSDERGEDIDVDVLLDTDALKEAIRFDERIAKGPSKAL